MLQHNFDHLKLIDGVLYCETVISAQTRKQLVLPYTDVTRMLQLLHSDVSHPGRHRALSPLRDSLLTLLAIGTSADVDNYIKTCRSVYVRLPLVNVITTQPLKCVSIS